MHADDKAQMNILEYMMKIDTPNPVLGYTILMQSGVDYARGKRMLALLEKQGYIYPVRKEKGRRGRSGVWWEITEEGQEQFDRLYADFRTGNGGKILDKLVNSPKGRIAIRMPCTEVRWREFVNLCKSGRVRVIIEDVNREDYQ